MGYTHYWTMKRSAEPDTFRLLADDAQALARTFESNGGAVSQQDGPEFSADCIRLNGREPDGYETFILTPEASDFEFCKTNFKPYDALVCAVLIAAKHHLADAISVKSDGEWVEWSDGAALYRQTFPSRSVPTTLDEDADD